MRSREREIYEDIARRKQRERQREESVQRMREIYAELHGAVGGASDDDTAGTPDHNRRV